METNKIYLGDCYQLIKDIPDKSIDLIITDPPYQFVSGGKGHSEIANRKAKNKNETYMLDTQNAKKYSKARQDYIDYVALNGKDEESERLRVIANAIDNKTNTAFVSTGITNDILDEMCRVMKKINIYIWCNKNQLRQYIDYFDDKGCNIDLLTWHKANPIPTCNNTYLSDTEYCVFARENGVKVYGTVATKKKYYVSNTNVEDKKKYKHPTIKPLEIIKNLVINSSTTGGVILDTFVGSGTTCVAAKELGRQYIGMEINEKYYKIACERLNGINAKGQTSIFTNFDEL